MTIEHTTTRLTVRANGEANSYTLLDYQGKWFMSLLMNGEQITARQEANLRRLAACWNACDGISTEALETGPAMLAAHQREQNRADAAQRRQEQLRNALEIVAAGNTDPDRMVELAQEAIAADNR